MAKAKGQRLQKLKAKPKSSTRAVNRSRPSKRRAASGRQRPKRRRGRSRASLPATFARRTFKSAYAAMPQYRDLGIAEATGGMVQAHVIRFVPPCRPRGSLEAALSRSRLPDGLCAQGLDQDRVRRSGCHRDATREAAWIQPPRIEHKVLDYSDDCEVLEIVLPADFKTVGARLGVGGGTLTSPLWPPPSFSRWPAAASPCAL